MYSIVILMVIIGYECKYIAREKLNEEGKTYDLKSYIERWESVKDSLISILE